MLDSDPCLRPQVGVIARRNSCRNPPWTSLDLRVSREVSTWNGQRAEFSLDLFNVLNGLSPNMGQYAAAYGEYRVLLTAVRYNPPAPPDAFDEPNAEQVVYRVNPGFGGLRAIGFDPLQFQAQLGVRYRF